MMPLPGHMRVKPLKARGFARTALSCGASGTKFPAVIFFSAFCPSVHACLSHHPHVPMASAALARMLVQAGQGTSLQEADVKRISTNPRHFQTSSTSAPLAPSLGPAPSFRRESRFTPSWEVS